MDDETSFRVAVGMLVVLIGLAAAGLSVGYAVSPGEEVTTVGYSMLAKLAWVAGAIGAMFAGWKIRLRSQEVGYGILCIVPMVLFCTLPRVLVNQVRVDNEGFAEREWRFFWSHKTEIKFSDYNNLIYQINRDRRGREDHQLVCRQGTDVSRQKVIGVGGLLRAALPAIVEHGEKRGVSVSLQAR